MRVERAEAITRTDELNQLRRLDFFEPKLMMFMLFPSLDCASAGESDDDDRLVDWRCGRRRKNPLTVSGVDAALAW